MKHNTRKNNKNPKPKKQKTKQNEKTTIFI